MYEQQMKYSKYLSNLFSAVTIAGLSILCLLNNLTIDLYSMLFLLKIVIPAAICNWIVGYVVGEILDKNQAKTVYKKMVNEKKAYEIPSIFAAPKEESKDENADDSLAEENDGITEESDLNNGEV